MGRNDARPRPQQQQGGSAVVPAQQGGAVQTQAQRDADAFVRVRGLVERRRDQLVELLGGDPRTADRWLTVTLAAFQTTPALLSCSELSILTGIRQAAQWQLEIGGPLSEASLIPEQGEARLQIEYRGLRKLALRNPDVIKVDAELVFERDTFRIVFGDSPRIEHEPYLDGDRGNLRGAYAFAKLRSGEIIPHWMSVAELNKRRDVSRSFRKGSGPWIQWADMMYRKTALSALCRSKLALDPQIREAVMLADDGDPNLAGQPIRATVHRPADDAAAKLRRRLSGGSIDEPVGELQAGQIQTETAERTDAAAEGVPDRGGPNLAGSGDPERVTPEQREQLPASGPADPATGELVDPAAAAKPVGNVCGKLSPYGDGHACRKPADHLAGNGSGAKIHASDFATWEDGQQA